MIFQLETGSIGIVYTDDELKLGIVGWKGKSTVRAYVPRNERLHYLRLIGADTSPYEKNKFQEQRDEEQKESPKENEKEGEGEETKPDDGDNENEKVNE